MAITSGNYEWQPLRRLIVGSGVLRSFLDEAARQYLECTPSMPLSCFAVLVGAIADQIAVVERHESGANVRATSDVALSEFAAGVAPAFGPAYLNRCRGYWCDPADLLRIHRAAEADGQAILGSIHMHPDWHRIGPPAERALRISERPTPMDQYMFVMTGWPVNMICYLERSGGQLCHRYAAWQHPLGQPASTPPARIPLQLRDSATERDKLVRR